METDLHDEILRWRLDSSELPAWWACAPVCDLRSMLAKRHNTMVVPRPMVNAQVGYIYNCCLYPFSQLCLLPRAMVV